VLGAMTRKESVVLEGLKLEVVGSSRSWTGVLLKTGTKSAPPIARPTTTEAVKSPEPLCLEETGENVGSRKARV
jgi:hypothetical protein